MDTPGVLVRALKVNNMRYKIVAYGELDDVTDATGPLEGLGMDVKSFVLDENYDLRKANDKLNAEKIALEARIAELEAQEAQKEGEKLGP